MKRSPLLIAVLVAAPIPVFAAESIPPAAWQRGDERLAEKWQQLTGKFIYQRVCTSCHKWGPNYWPRSRWEQYLKAFPGNHEPDVSGTYKDLTAMSETDCTRINRRRSCADVQHSAEAKIADIQTRVCSLQKMRKALRKLAEQCASGQGNSACPILEHLETEL